jgi:hypothetical protein
MNKDLRLMFLTGLLSTRGELTEDFCIDYYMGINDSMLTFGWWLDEHLTEEEFDILVKSNSKDQSIMDYYRLYKNQQLDWDTEDNRPMFETVDELKVWLSNRASIMRHRWALEKKANGGFTMMDHWTLNPAELTELLRPAMESIERGDECISSEEFLRKLRARGEAQ